MLISHQNKKIAKTAATAFGGKPIVVQYWDDDKKHCIELLHCADRPFTHITSYTTIGLADYTIGYSVDDVPLRIELIGVADARFIDFPNVLASCAFHVIHEQQSCAPGTVFQNVVSMYFPDSAMAHVLFVPPFLWEGHLDTIHFPDKKVAWLLAVPISEQELQYATSHGMERLESVFEEAQIDIFDLYRKSVR